MSCLLKRGNVVVHLVSFVSYFLSLSLLVLSEKSYELSSETSMTYHRPLTMVLYFRGVRQLEPCMQDRRCMQLIQIRPKIKDTVFVLVRTLPVNST